VEGAVSILPHWIFQLAHVNQHNLEPDELHIIWLGTAMCFFGSVLWMLVFRVLPNAASSNMASLWDQISRCYSDMGISTQHTNLSIGSFCNAEKPNGHYPKLKGKGAEVKGLTLVLCKVWNDNMIPDNEEHKLIAEAIDAQSSLACIIDDYASDLFLPPEKAVEFQRHVINFLSQYSELCHIADARGDLLWNMTTKFHWLFHLGQRAHYLCPRRGACWIDEDYINKCKEVAQACSAGTPLHKIPSRMVEKMRWGLSLMHDGLRE